MVPLLSGSSMTISSPLQPELEILLQAIQRVEIKFQGVPLFQRLQQCLHWWEKHAPQDVLLLIREGVRAE